MERWRDILGQSQGKPDVPSMASPGSLEGTSCLWVLASHLHSKELSLGELQPFLPGRKGSIC